MFFNSQRVAIFALDFPSLEKTECQVFFEQAKQGVF